MLAGVRKSVWADYLKEVQTTFMKDCLTIISTTTTDYLNDVFP